jgi:hypothetical protein
LSGAVTDAPVCDGAEYDTDPLPGVVWIAGIEAGTYTVQEAVPPTGAETAADVTVEATEGQIAEVTVVHRAMPDNGTPAT